MPSVKDPNIEQTTTVQVAEIKCSGLWTIYDYNLSINSDHYPEINSPSFAGGCNNELKWYMKLYPSGFDKGCKEYLSLFINFFEMDEFREVYINFEISIMNDKNEIEYTKKSVETLKADNSMKFDKFVEKDYLMDEKNNLMLNNKLILLCKVTAHCYYDISNEEQNYKLKIFKSKLEVGNDVGKFLDGSFSDVIFFVDREKFNLHKAVLASRSNIFSAMFENEMLEKTSNSVIITDISSESFSKVLQYIYFGIIMDINDLPEKLIKELLIAADKYELNDLKDMCEKVLFKQLYFNNAIEMLTFADRYNAGNLKDQIIQFIAAHNKSFVHDIEVLSETHASFLPQIIKEKTNFSDCLDDDFYFNCYDFEEELVNKNVFIEGKCWGITQLLLNEHSYTWRINNLSFLMEKQDSYEILHPQDDLIQDGKTFSWQLVLYPNGIKEEADHVSLYVQFTDDGKKPREIRAQYEFIVTNGRGELIRNVKSDILIFFTNNEKLGEAKLFKKDSFPIDSGDDTLVITCKIISIPDVKKRISQPFPMNCDAFNYQANVGRDFGTLLENSKFSDITLVAGDKKFYLHRSILEARCPAFLRVIDEYPKETHQVAVKTNDIEPDILSELLLFIYSGNVTNLSSKAKHIFVEAKKYELPKLQDICEAYLGSTLNVDNVCDHLIFAYLNGAQCLRSKAISCIIDNDNLELVMKTAGYSSLADSRPQLLKDILHRV